METACAAIVAALPGYKKQTLKSQMRDRLLIVKLGAAWYTNITFLAVFFQEKLKGAPNPNFLNLTNREKFCL